MKQDKHNYKNTIKFISQFPREERPRESTYQFNTRSSRGQARMQVVVITSITLITWKTNQKMYSILNRRLTLKEGK